jgi:drug/metabolite transporter (DMT)-like permease
MTRFSEMFAASSGNAKGIAWMFLTGLIFVFVTGAVRHLASDMHPVQLAFLRYAIGMIFLAPVIIREIRQYRSRNRRYGLHASRGLLHAIGVMLWFYAMAHIPVAEVTALGFTAPIFATIGAALFLGERLYARRIGAVIFGFAGAMVILRPGIQAIELGAIAQLCAAPLFAASLLISKKLTETEHNSTIVAVMGVFVTLALLPPAVYVWRSPTFEEMIWLFGVAGMATLGHLTMTQAFRCAEITALQPISFLQLVWATLLGFYVFGEEPDIWTWVGGGIIVTSATYIAHREARARNRARVEAEEEAE